MKKYTIKSRKLKKEVTFSIPGKSYIFVDLNGQPGSLGNQICDGGGLTGSTISYWDGGSHEGFEKVCRAWFKKYLREA